MLPPMVVTIFDALELELELRLALETTRARMGSMRDTYVGMRGGGRRPREDERGASPV